METELRGPQIPGNSCSGTPEGRQTNQSQRGKIPGVASRAVVIMPQEGSRDLEIRAPAASLAHCQEFQFGGAVVGAGHFFFKDS